MSRAQVPSEILSLETCSAGYSLVTFMNFIMTFVVSQSFLSMLCALNVGTSATAHACSLSAPCMPAHASAALECSSMHPSAAIGWEEQPACARVPSLACSPRQVGLSWVCSVGEQFGIFLFIAGWVMLMTIFVMLLVPETRNVPLVRHPSTCLSPFMPVSGAAARLLGTAALGNV